MSSNEHPPLALSAARGGFAGIVATLGMTALMIGAERAGIMRRHPPEEIAGDALQAAGVVPTRDRVDAAASVAHLGFGAVCGIAFELISTGPARRLDPVAVAIPFALAIWAVSYAGWVPALGIMPPPDHDEPGRPATMIAAHVVYGALLGVLRRVGPGGTG